MKKSFLFVYFLICTIFTISAPMSLKASDMELAKKFAPLVFFHPSERYFPSSVEFAFNNMTLMRETESRKKISLGPLDVTKKKRQAEVVAKPGFSGNMLAGKDDKHFLEFRGDGQIKDIETYYKGEPLAGGVSKAPVYVRVYKIDSNTVAIMYAYFYPYNGPLSVASVGGKGLIGYHEGDWEHIEVFIQKRGEDWKLLSVHFARHGREAGEHLNFNEFEVYQETHPVVLSAMYGHGSYPSHTSGVTKHVDRVAKGTNKWETWNNIVLINDSTPWNNSKVRFGATQSLTNSSPMAPKQQSPWQEMTKYSPPKIQVASNPIDQAKEVHKVSGIKDEKSPEKFSKDISSQYRNICFQLVPEGGSSADQSIGFDIMERKRLSKDKTLYENPAGGGCHALKTPSMKGYYVKFKGGNYHNRTFTLVIKGY